MRKTRCSIALSACLPRTPISAGAIALTASLLLSGGACSSPPSDTADPEAEAEWVGTITTEGDVTTVVNESGSVWGGDVELVEELSIGVEAGADEYMFGQVRDVWATGGHIYVLDSQVPTLRVYDDSGAHVMDIGRQGQGPGEFTDPAGLVVNDQGDLLVIENNLQVDVFAEDGSPKATWNSGSSWSVYRNEMIVLGVNGEVWVPKVVRDPIRFGHAKIGPDGNRGEAFLPPEIDYEPACLTFQRRGQEEQYCGIPFRPYALNALMRDGGWVVGMNDEYALDVHHPDGATFRVQRFWDPVPVGVEEAANRKQQTIDLINERMSPDTEYVWNGPEIPSHKPAYIQLMPDRDGRIWVLREQESVLSTDCLEDVPECWIPAAYWLDAFGPEGRYLGSTTLESRPVRRPYIDGTTIVAIEIDAGGTYVVKKYRLALPGEVTVE